MKYILPIIFFLLGCYVAGGEEIKVGRLHTVELCSTDDQVVVHQIGVPADTMQFEKDGKRCMVIVPQESGRITLMLTIVNFEDKKLESKDVYLDCVGERPVPKPEPAPDGRLEPLSRLLTLLDAKYHSFIIATMRSLTETISERDNLTISRINFNDLLRTAIEAQKARDKIADEVDFSVFLEAVHKDMNRHIAAGDIVTSIDYKNHIKTIGESNE